MPPRSKTTKRAGAEVGKRYPLNMRTTVDIRRALESAANQSGRSLAQEAEFRLERSFAEESAYGGAEMRGIALKMAAAFHTAGMAAAASQGNPDLSSAQWIVDPNCYRTAAFAVVASLAKSFPGADIEDLLKFADGAASMITALKADLVKSTINKG